MRQAGAGAGARVAGTACAAALRTEAWNHWAEVVLRDPRHAEIIGDMPVAGEEVRLEGMPRRVILQD